MLGIREFLERVVWYWIVAREAQAERFQQNRNEAELRPITATRSEEFLLRLFDLQQDIEQKKTKALAYIPHLCALRVTRAEFGLTLGPKFGDDDFSNLFSGEGRPFYDLARVFVHEPRYAAWRERPLKIAKENHLPSYFRRYLTAASTITPPFYQTLLQWNEQRGVTWIVLRALSHEDARQFPTWPLKRLNALTAGYDQHRHIRGGHRLWIQHVAADIDRLDISRYTALARQLIGAANDNAPSHLAQGVFGLPSPTRLLVLPKDMLGMPLPPTPAAAQSTLVITNGTYAQVAHELPAPSHDHEYAVFDVESALDFLDARPWVWSEYIRSDSAVGVFAPSDLHKLALFFGDDTELQVRSQYLASLHPTVALTPAGNVRVIGAPGTGKTSVILSLLRAFTTEAAKLCIRGADRTSPAFLRSLLDALLRNGPVVVAVDDLGWQKQLPEGQTIIGYAAQLRRTHDVRFVVSYLTAEADTVEANFANAFRDTTAIHLDHPGAQFLSEIAGYQARVSSVEATKPALDALGAFFEATDDRAVAVAEYVKRFAGKRLLVPRVSAPSWPELYEELLRRPDGRECKAVLAAAAIAQALGVTRISCDTVREMLALEGHSIAVVDGAIKSVVRQGWVARTGDELLLTRAPLEPAKDDLLPYDLKEDIGNLGPADLLFTFPQVAPSQECLRFLRLLEDRPRFFPRADRLQLLTQSASLYERAGDWAAARGVMERAVREFPEDRFARFGALTLCLALGDITAAEAHVVALATQEPFDEYDRTFWTRLAGTFRIGLSPPADELRRRGRDLGAWSKIADLLRAHGAHNPLAAIERFLTERDGC